jgi:hypothetical protein
MNEQGSIGWDLLENDLRLNDSTDVLHVPNVFGADDADLNLFQPACFSFYAYMPIPILTVARGLTLHCTAIFKISSK